MTGKRLFRVVVAIVTIWAIQFQSVAQAVNVSGFDAMITRIVQGTPGMGGITMQGTANGLNLATTGNVTATTSAGMRIPVPTTATAGISRATLALNAARLARATTVIGAGIGAYEVYNWIKDRGIKTCAPPAFFCAPSTDQPVIPNVTWSYWFDTINGGGGVSQNAACDGAASAMSNWYQSRGDNMAVTVKQYPTKANGYDCLVNAKGIGFSYTTDQTMLNKSTCTNGANFARFDDAPCGGTVQPPAAGAPYASDQALADAISISQWDFGHAENLADAINKGRQRLPGVVSQTDLVPANSPVTVSAPPVTLPETVTKVETVTNPDGSTSTKTTKEKITVTPTVTPPATGSPTLANPPTVAAPVTTTSTVTTTNNTTNVTTTNTTTTSEQSQPAEEPSPLCKMFPDIVACAKLGEAPDAEKLVPVDVTPTITNVVFASAAACPAPITYNMGRLGGGKAIEFAPMCDWLAGIRPLLLAIATVGTAFIFMRGVQQA